MGVYIEFYWNAKMGCYTSLSNASNTLHFFTLTTPLQNYASKSTHIVISKRYQKTNIPLYGSTHHSKLIMLLKYHNMNYGNQMKPKE